MTKHQAFPLRGAQAWPGINTLGGTLDDGSGQLTDRSSNVMINTADVLQKRKGFIRGMDEQFTGPVCGLHRYTDECGLEFLLVADQDAIQIRTPYKIPVFEVSDAYPNDGFSGTTTSVDLSRWRDTSLGYRHLDSSLVLRSGVTDPNPLQWFKEAASLSYGMETKYSFPNEAGTETIDLFIKAAASDGDGSIRLRLQNAGGSLTVALDYVDPAGSTTSLGSGGLIPGGTALTGDVTEFKYDAATRTAEATVFVDQNGTPVVMSGSINVAQDADLGQNSLVKLSASAASEVGLEEISSEPI